MLLTIGTFNLVAGFDGNAAARVFVKLMKRLGHEKFYVHGGDWGNLIVRLISIIFPEK